MSSSPETSTLSTDHTFINRTDIAYAAGILDGEGCISVTYTDNNPYLIIDVTNTNRGLIDWYHARFGGAIYDKHCAAKWGQKPQWSWRPAARDQKWFLKLMVPFLKVKIRQARLALVLRSMIERRCSKARKVRIAEWIKTYND